ncbi:hypothetical protein CY34DRAFT_245145, partial [Suillus luteus UH-Slu-Lm8-n1]
MTRRRNVSDEEIHRHSTGLHQPFPKGNRRVLCWRNARPGTTKHRRGRTSGRKRWILGNVDGQRQRAPADGCETGWKGKERHGRRRSSRCGSDKVRAEMKAPALTEQLMADCEVLTVDREFLDA